MRMCSPAIVMFTGAFQLRWSSARLTFETYQEALPYASRD